MYLWPTTWATLELCVSARSADASTFTDWFCWPTSRVRSTASTCAVVRATFCRTTVSNPGAAASTRYVPGSIELTRYAPVSLVRAASATPDWVFTTRTVALATAA